MKLVAIGFLMSLAAAVGCMTGPAAGDPPAATDDPAVSEAQSDVIQPRVTCASQGDTACLNGPTCHHEEGGNIGRFDCPSGTICCRF